MKIETAKYVSGGQFTSRGEWSHPERSISSFELIVVTEGNVWIEEDGKEYTLEAGDIFLLEPDKLHFGSRVSQTRVSFYWFHFVDYRPPEHTGIAKQMRLEDPYAVSLLCRQLLYFASAGFSGDVLHAALHTLLSEVEHQGGARDAEANTLVRRIREWIRINSDRALTVSDVSTHFGYNVDHLSRLFRMSYGHGLKSEIAEMKLRRVKQLLLESDLTLFQIADRVGISDYKLFLKFFKYHEGVTPSTFRKIYSDIHTNNR